MKLHNVEKFEIISMTHCLQCENVSFGREACALVLCEQNQLTGPEDFLNTNPGRDKRGATITESSRPPRALLGEVVRSSYWTAMGTVGFVEVAEFLDLCYCCWCCCCFCSPSTSTLPSLGIQTTAGYSVQQGSDTDTPPGSPQFQGRINQKHCLLMHWSREREQVERT
jgi:hypothetical protein